MQRFKIVIEIEVEGEDAYDVDDVVEGAIDGGLVQEVLADEAKNEAVYDKPVVFQIVDIKSLPAVPLGDVPAENSTWLYLSFAGESGFLGGCFVEATDVVEGAKEAHRRGINPGGQVAAYPVPVHVKVPESYRNRLLSKQEVEAMHADRPS